MKWRVHPDARAEQLKKLRGKAASSGPNSPAAGAAVNPNFRGPNGQPLGYDSSYAGQFQLNDGATEQQRNQTQTSLATSPIFSSQQPREAFTPDRSGNAQRRRNTLSGDPNDDGPTFDDSPLPPNRQNAPPFTLNAQSPPTLSSSYLDTPFHGPSTNMITPAPQRRNVQLAPPSTLIAPSKYMPESSPAGPGTFPFFMGRLGATPGGPLLADISPLKKTDDDDANGRNVMSSSPPPVDSGSPSKKGRGTPNLSSMAVAASSSATKREMSHHSIETDGRHSAIATTVEHDDDEDDDDGGFDLARGFQPIGSFASGRSQSGSQPPAMGRAGIGSRT